MKPIFAIGCVATVTVLVAACSPRFGYQPDDHRLLLPVSGPGDYMVDNRFKSPDKTYVPDSLPHGVYDQEERHEIPRQFPPMREGN